MDVISLFVIIPILIYIAIFAIVVYLIVTFIQFMKNKTRHDQAMVETMTQLVQRVDSLEQILTQRAELKEVEKRE
ncbi:hypothetical protein FZC66_07970 [Priestia megaterium]|nr:hypothetical protein FZC66_07970 [Priestia megaterium]